MDTRRGASSSIQRVPPHDLDSEVAVLGSVLLDGGRDGLKAVLRTGLEERHFYRGAHRSIFRAMLKARDGGGLVDPGCVRRSLNGADEPDVGWVETLAQLVESVQNPAHGAHYARRVLECARRREAIQAGCALLEDAWDESADFEGALRTARVTLRELPGAARLEREPFPIDALPVFARQLVKRDAHLLDVDIGAIATSYLAVIGAAIGNTVRLRMGPRRTSPPTGYFCLLGPSGSDKSGVVEAGVRHLRPLHRDMVRQTREDVKAWQRKSKEERGDQDPPPRRKALVQDLNTPTVAVLFRDNLRGLLLHHPELGGWFSSLNQLGAGRGDDPQKFCQFWGGEAVAIARKTGSDADRDIELERPLLSILGACQPKLLAEALADRRGAREIIDSGLLPRFLLVHMPPRAKRWRENDGGLARSAEAEAVFDRLTQIPMERDALSNVLRPRELVLTSDARDRWRTFHDDYHRRLQEEEDPWLQVSYAKLVLYAARLALLDHVCYLAEGVTEARHIEWSPVPLESLERGIELVCWFQAEQAICYRILRDPSIEGAHSRLVEFISKRGRVTRRDISNGGPAEYRKAAVRDAALEDLKERGRVRLDGRAILPAGGAR